MQRLKELGGRFLLGVYIAGYTEFGKDMEG